VLHQIHRGENCENIRPGDVVFSYKPAVRAWPLHAGIYAGREKPVRPGRGNLEVVGVPDPLSERQNFLGCSNWTATTEYVPSIIGRRVEDADPIQVKEVKIVATAMIRMHRAIGTSCEWKRTRIVSATRYVLDGIGLFEQGTCTHFVEYCYENAGLDLVDQDYTRDPDEPHRIYPATQIHVFLRGSYPLRCQWDSRLRYYPDCLF